MPYPIRCASAASVKSIRFGDLRRYALLMHAETGSRRAPVDRHVTRYWGIPLGVSLVTMLYVIRMVLDESLLAHSVLWIAGVTSVVIGSSFLAGVWYAKQFVASEASDGAPL